MLWRQFSDLKTLKVHVNRSDSGLVFREIKVGGVWEAKLPVWGGPGDVGGAHPGDIANYSASILFKIFLWSIRIHNSGSGG